MSSKSLVVALSLVVLVTPACTFGETRVDVFGLEVVDTGGVVEVDGTPVPFARWEPVTLDLVDVTTLRVATATGAITLEGAAGDVATLECEVLSEHEDDGRVVVDDGRLVARSDAGAVVVNAVRGSVPARLALSVTTGSGPVTLSGLDTGGAVDVESGTSDVEIRDGSSGSLAVVDGIGATAVRRWTTGRLEAEAGTSDVRLDVVEAESVDVTAGNGDVTLDGCRLGEARLELGTGDLRVVDTICSGLLSCTAGTGDVDLRGGVLGRLETELGLGAVSRTGTEIRDGAP